MRYLALMMCVGCAHLYTLDDADTHPTHDNAYSDGHMPGSMVAKTILGSGAISLSGISLSPTFTKITVQTIQMPPGGSLAGVGCLGHSSSDSICFNPNQMDVAASSSINLNVSSGGSVNFAGSTSVDASGNFAARGNLLQVNSTQVLARSNSLTQFSVGTSGTPWLDVQSSGVAVGAIPLTQGASTGSLANGNISYTSGGAFAAASLQVTANGSVTLTNNAMTRTAPTISSGFGTSPSVATNNGTAAFTINVGTGGVATSGVIGLPAATNGWVCSCDDLTQVSTSPNKTIMTATSTTSCTVTNKVMSTGAAAAWAASDILHCMAMGR